MSILAAVVGIAGILFLLFILFIRFSVNGGLYRRYCDHITTKLHGKTAIITGIYV